MTSEQLMGPDSCNGAARAPRLVPVQERALRALWQGPVMREQLDRVAGTSNSPETVRQLRSKGIEIECTIVEKVDRDGRACWPGRYSLMPAARVLLRSWGFA